MINKPQLLIENIIYMQNQTNKTRHQICDRLYYCHILFFKTVEYNIDGSAQDYSTSIANALDLLQSGTEPSTSQRYIKQHKGNGNPCNKLGTQ